MRVPIVRSILAGLLVLGSTAPATSAASGFEILNNVNFQTGVEVFWATGFCPSGTAVTGNLVIQHGRDARASSFHLDKTFTCDDGSGTLSIHVDAATSYGTSTGDQGGWSVTGGTGRWAGASGGGSEFGTYTPTGVLDDYLGTLHG